MQLKNLIRYLYYYVYKTSFYNLLLTIKKNLPVIGKKYKQIDKYKDLHKGQRCFIVATGPSLTIDDVNKLKNEVTFSMNSIIKIFDQTDWRPTYYGIQDIDVYKKLKHDIQQSGLKHVFYADLIRNFCLKDAIPYRIDLQKHLLGESSVKYSSDFSKIVYDGYSITYSMIQLATYMGFNKIYLLGCDTNYNGSQNHIIEYGEPPKGIDAFYDHAIISYQVAKEYACNHNIHIYNITRGGMLEVFERKDIDSILGTKK